jgi:hypothetical protein
MRSASTQNVRRLSKGDRLPPTSSNPSAAAAFRPVDGARHDRDQGVRRLLDGGARPMLTRTNSDDAKELGG